MDQKGEGCVDRRNIASDVYYVFVQVVISGKVYVLCRIYFG